MMDSEQECLGIETHGGGCGQGSRTAERETKHFPALGWGGVVAPQHEVCSWSETESESESESEFES